MSYYNHSNSPSDNTTTTSTTNTTMTMDIPNCLTPTINLEDQLKLMKQQLSSNSNSNSISTTNFTKTNNNNNNTTTTTTTTTTNSHVSSPSETLQPLSPPLSPYQRNATLYSIKQPLPQLPTKLPTCNPNSKSYLVNGNNHNEFNLENFNDYKLTINIKPISKNYYYNQLKFLNKYDIKRNFNHNSIMGVNNISGTLPIRKYKKRLVYDSSNDDITSTTNNNTDVERIRTRRVVRSSGNTKLDTDTDYDYNYNYDSLNNPSTPLVPKKKNNKKKKKVNPPHGHSSSSSSSSPSIPILTLQQQLIDESIPDYSPDVTTTLPPNNSKCLKIDWKGQPMDLSNDPNLNKLKHPGEILLASILRLPIAVYLDSKRRLFYEKVSRLKQGKSFRRTDAQKACRIDVNKASRLFAAFEKVGWLNDELFEKYL